MPVYTFSSEKTSDVKEYIPANNIPCEDAVGIQVSRDQRKSLTLLPLC